MLEAKEVERVARSLLCIRAMPPRSAIAYSSMRRVIARVTSCDWNSKRSPARVRTALSAMYQARTVRTRESTRMIQAACEL